MSIYFLNFFNYFRIFVNISIKCLANNSLFFKYLQEILTHKFPKCSIDVEDKSNPEVNSATGLVFRDCLFRIYV